MSFVHKRSVDPDAGRHVISGTIAPFNTIIANSEVVQIGDAVETDSSGFIIASNSVGSAARGILIGVDQDNAVNGVSPDTNTVDTYTVASDNQTVGKIYAIIDVSPFSIYSATIDATPGTTTGSDLSGYYADMIVNDETQLDESTASATTGKFHLWGTDPDDSARVMCNINEIAHINNSV